MTAHDTWLNIGSDGPAERDESVFDAALEQVAVCMYASEKHIEAVSTLSNAYPALAYAMRELDFPIEYRAEIAALVNLAADLRAKVDDEYAARVANYEDPCDE